MTYPLHAHLPTVPELQHEVEALKNMNSKLQSDKFALEDTIREKDVEIEELKRRLTAYENQGKS